jgi:filamentous hemagglutinin
VQHLARHRAEGEASQAAVSLINNQGDVGKTLNDLGSDQSIQQLLASVLTAGLTAGVTSGLNLPNPAANTTFASRFTTYATQAMVGAGVKSLVYGQPLEETAKTALIGALAQSLTSEIGDWGKEYGLQPGSAAKIVAHAVVQCAAASVQGADCGSAALGGAIAEALAPVSQAADASELSQNLKLRGQIGNAIASMSTLLAASLTGSDTMTALGGAQMVDYYNRQLHPAETQRIKELANGDPQKAARLTAAACALVRCADGIPQTDPGYAALNALQDAGGKLTAEQNLLKQQSGWDGRAYGSLFQYTWGQQLTDSFTANQVGTRLVGAAQTVGGTAGVVGSGALCSSGFGCAAGAITGTISLDYALAGLQQTASGQKTTPYGEQVLQSLGLSPQTAAVAYAIGGLLPGATQAVIAARAVDAQMAANAWVRGTYTGTSVSQYEGTVYRYTLPDQASGAWQIWPGNIERNMRYSESGIGALYSGTTAPTAAAEVSSYGPLSGRVLVTNSVVMNNVLDLTNPAARQALGVSLSDITQAEHGGSAYSATQRISAWARDQGYQGILAPSAQSSSGGNLVSFSPLRTGGGAR